MIEIVHAQIADKISILDFIKTNISKSHILTRKPEIFDHYFFYKKKLLCFFIAKENNKVLGILGYSLPRNYSDLDTKILYLQMWFVMPNLNAPVGLMLLRKIEKEILCDIIICLGVNYNVLPIYKILGYETGISTQWLLKRRDFTNNNEITIKETLEEPQNNLHKIKNIDYLSNKYLDCMFREYKPYTVFKNNIPYLSLVGRFFYDDYNNKKVFRVVDFTGDPEMICFLFSIENLPAECIEINLNFPKRETILSQFVVSQKSDFIRLYNEPPINEFKQKHYAYKTMKKNNLEFYIVSGDCDQDRPNI